MLKKTMVGFAIGVLALATWGVSSARAAGPFGLGVIFGEPTGVSGKHLFSQTRAIDFGAAWSFSRGGNFHLHMDYLFVDPALIKIDTAHFDLFYGIGPRFVFSDDFRFGARIPVGISFWAAQRAVEFFLELAPILDLAPGTDMSFNGGIGVRYFF